MRAGTLRHRVTLQQPTETQGSTGEVTDSFSPVVSGLAAEVLPLRGREFYSSREIHSELTTKITIRYRSDITNEWRVVHGSRTYEVEHVIDLKGRRRVLELMCSEVR